LAPTGAVHAAATVTEKFAAFARPTTQAN